MGIHEARRPNSVVIHVPNLKSNYCQLHPENRMTGERNESYVLPVNYDVPFNQQDVFSPFSKIRIVTLGFRLISLINFLY